MRGPSKGSLTALTALNTSMVITGRFCILNARSEGRDRLPRTQPAWTLAHSIELSTVANS